jgi:hypothetical protein
VVTRTSEVQSVPGEDYAALQYQTWLTWFDCIADTAVVSRSTVHGTVQPEPVRGYKQKNLQQRAAPVREVTGSRNEEFWSCF